MRYVLTQVKGGVASLTRLSFGVHHSPIAYEADHKLQPLILHTILSCHSSSRPPHCYYLGSDRQVFHNCCSGLISQLAGCLITNPEMDTTTTRIHTHDVLEAKIL